MTQNPRQLAFLALLAVRQGAFADVALDRVIRQADLTPVDRRLVTELVYGSVRRLRTLDALIDQLAKKKAHQQPPNLRTILHLGLYQLRYLEQVPAAAAVNTTVELAKQNGFLGLAGFVNGLMRQYVRLSAGGTDPLQLPQDLTERLAVQHSYPDWIVKVWLEQLDVVEVEQLSQLLNQPPRIDLRVNPLRVSLEKVESALQAAGVLVSRVPHLPQALRLLESSGPIQDLPGFAEGWWTVQDSSAQLVGHLLSPEPGEMVIDACAAPGGKATHLAELMADRGTVWACVKQSYRRKANRASSRLEKLNENAERLHLHSIQVCIGDSRNLPQFTNQADRVLLDAPCSGLGTLHRHADARWRQTPQTVEELTILQQQLLDQAATWVKPRGILVYATCTLNPAENEHMIQQFLARHPTWEIDLLPADSAVTAFVSPEGWVNVWPHRHSMDGFFMVRLVRQN